MRKLLLVGAALLTAITAFGDQQQFEAGYKHGHGEFAIPPVKPVPPIAPVGQNSHGEGFIYGTDAVQSY